MTDGDVAVWQLGERLLVKHLRHHAQLLDGEKPAVVVDGDTGAHMTSVLQAVERVVCNADDVKFVVVFIYSEYAALVVCLVASGVDYCKLIH